jgi:hypothetical protein
LQKAEATTGEARDILAAVPQIDYLGIELLRAEHEAEAFTRFKNLPGGAQRGNLKGADAFMFLNLSFRFDASPLREHVKLRFAVARKEQALPQPTES